METENKSLHLIGYAYGGGGADPHTGDGPQVLKDSSYLSSANIHCEWDAMLIPDKDPKEVHHTVKNICNALANKVSYLAQHKNKFTVIGGDHTSAIGTWSGAFDAYHQKGDIGLIWIDAHMDSHTPETSESQRIHGMPLATLLGAGYKGLVSVLHEQPKFKPQHVCLIGVRSYEEGEKDFLNRNNVRIYYMEEVNRRGFVEVLREAIDNVTRNTIGFGVSLDLDSIDPIDAPAVAVPAPNGIRSKDLLAALPLAFTHPRFIGAEIVEFDPVRDIEDKTEKIVVSVLEMLDHQ